MGFAEWFIVIVVVLYALFKVLEVFADGYSR